MSHKDISKTSQGRLKDISKTSQRPLKDVLRTTNFYSNTQVKLDNMECYFNNNIFLKFVIPSNSKPYSVIHCNLGINFCYKYWGNSLHKQI